MIKKKKKRRQFKNIHLGNSLAVQWLGLCTFTAEGLGSIPGPGTRILQAVQHGTKKKKKVIQNNNNFIIY